MTSTTAEFAISGIMLLVGATTFVFSRSVWIGVLRRPLSWSLGLFGLGIWALFGTPLTGIQSCVVPLSMILSILWGLRPDRAPIPVAARKLGARFVSLGFLILLGISGDLVVLYFASEAAALSMLAEQTWDSPLPVHRRKLLARTLGSMCLLAAGVAFVASFAGTTSLDSIEARLSDHLERAGSLMQDTHAGSELLQVGLILLVTGAAWRLSFFPFLDNGGQRESLSDESQIVRIFSITVFLSVVIPRLVGAFEESQILLVTFGLSTFVRGTVCAMQTDYLESSFRALLSASAALIWIILGVGLQSSIAGYETTEGFRFPAEEILIFELECSLVIFLLLTLVIERDSPGCGRFVNRDRLAGMRQRGPVAGLLSILLLLIWTGLFAIPGRWSLLFEGFQIAASNQSAAGGYYLVSLVVLACLCSQQFFAIQLCQLICTRGWLSRTISPRVPDDQEITAPRSVVMQGSTDH